MSNAPEKDDDQWLNTLAGRIDSSADSKINMQAQALRRALQSRAEQLETKVPFADEQQYQRLLFRLRREKLLLTDTGWRVSPSWLKVVKILGLPADLIRWRSPAVWGLAATLVLGVTVVMQSGGLLRHQDEADILRGGTATTLIVPDPEARLVELLAGLRATGEEPVVKHIGEGAIVLTVVSNAKVADYLGTQRIEPTVTSGTITILLIRPKVTAK